MINWLVESADTAMGRRFFCTVCQKMFPININSLFLKPLSQEHTMKHLLLSLFAFTAIASAQTASTDAPVTDNADKIFRSTEVDLKPQLPDGMYTLSLFISDNFKFPEAVKNKKITIFSSFVIEPDGTMTNVKAFHINVKDYIASDVVKIATQDEKLNEADQIETMKGE